MLCILAIRLLPASPPGSDLGSVADPELKSQLRQQSLAPARVPTGFHPHAHLHSLGGEIAVELLRFLTVLQSLLSTISSFGIHKRNLLEARVIIASYNDHCPAPFYPSLHGWFGTTKFTRAWEPALLWNQLHSQPVTERNLVSGSPFLIFSKSERRKSVVCLRAPWAWTSYCRPRRIKIWSHGAGWRGP